MMMPVQAPIQPAVAPAVASAAAARAGADRTVVDQIEPSRARQRLRPELIRAFEATGFAALVLVGLYQAVPDALDSALHLLETELVGDDVVVRVADEKLAVVIGGSSARETRAKVEALRRGIEQHRAAASFPEVALVATYLPEDASDPDEALMRASTALVIAKKQRKVGP